MTITNPPAGYPQLTAYLHVENAVAAIDFYTRALSAVERYRLPIGDKIGHAELVIGSGLLMLSDMCPEDRPLATPPVKQVPPISLMLYVTDVDATAQTAADAGAMLLSPPADQFYGDRTAMIRDPFGMIWTLAQRVRDVSPEEAIEAVKAMGKPA